MREYRTSCAHILRTAQFAFTHYWFSSLLINCDTNTGIASSHWIGEHCLLNGDVFMLNSIDWSSKSGRTIQIHMHIDGVYKRALMCYCCSMLLIGSLTTMTTMVHNTQWIIFPNIREFYQFRANALCRKIIMLLSTVATVIWILCIRACGPGLSEHYIYPVSIHHNIIIFLIC